MKNVFKEGRKWIAESEATGTLRRSVPLGTKKQARAWIAERILEAQVGSAGERLMSAAIVKGLVEHKDGTRFFGSTMSYRAHFENAVNRGLVTEDGGVSEQGAEWYERCLKRLPQSRQVFWNATDIGAAHLADCHN